MIRGFQWPEGSVVNVCADPESKATIVTDILWSEEFKVDDLSIVIGDYSQWRTALLAIYCNTKMPKALGESMLWC